MADGNTYSVPQYVRDYISKAGYPVPYTEMEQYIKAWWSWFQAKGPFYDYVEVSESGLSVPHHRLTIKPAKKMSKEWSALLFTDQTKAACDDQACTDWLDSYYRRIGFYPKGQGIIARSFGLGTGAWALWLDTEAARMQVRRYDARMVLPLSWDDDGVSECAFCTRFTSRGKAYDQVQMHVSGDGGYHIVTACFDSSGREVPVEGVIPDLPTGCPTPTFAIITPAEDNACVDFSPYGQSVFADAIDAVQGVDVCYDAFVNEIADGKMRLFASDALFETVSGGGSKVAVPFGLHDETVLRKVASVDDMIKEFAPALRTSSQMEAYRAALKTLGDLCGFGMEYFDVDQTGGITTATAVASNNSKMMRKVRDHENLLGRAVAQISHAVLHCARAFMGASLPDEGDVRVLWDDSIIQDTASEKQQDLAEVGVTMNAWEYRVKWYGEDEETAKANAPQAVEPRFGVE